MRVRLDLVWVGLSLVLAGLALVEAVHQRRWDTFAYFALHLQAAALFYRRLPAINGPLPPVHQVVPAIGVLYAYGFETPSETVQGNALVFAGCLLCLSASGWLGRSYGVLPSLRVLQTRGPYRIVRHPIYAAYLLMDLGLVVNAPTSRNLAVIVTGASCYVWRIVIEERVLAQSPLHRFYTHDVPYRLLPGVY